MGIRTIIILLVGLALASVHRAEAQQTGKVPRIAYLHPGPAAIPTRMEAFRQGLRELGYVEGKNIAIEYRYGDGKTEAERLPDLAAELVRLKVDIIVVAEGVIPIQATKNATKTIPIVMSGVGPILSRQAWLKASPVPAATSPALQTLK